MRTAKACCTDYTENTSFTTMPKDFRPIGRGIKHVETCHVMCPPFIGHKIKQIDFCI